jgi:hypothetical protein
VLLLLLLLLLRSYYSCVLLLLLLLLLVVVLVVSALKAHYCWALREILLMLHGLAFATPDQQAAPL